MHTRYCVACEEEFRPEIVHCSDCGALLEDRYGDESAEADAPEPAQDAEPAPALAPEDSSLVFSARDSMAIRRAAAGLAAAGIAFRVNGHATGFDLLVSRKDRDAAIAALRGSDGSISMAPESEAAASAGRCPACGTTVAAGAVECPECQLVVGDDRSICDGCSSEVGPDDTNCPECGAPLSRA